jgi:hypothetical protein
MALKVICAGMSRTGTVSLKLAIEALGFGPCQHGVDIYLNPERVPLWERAFEGKADWDAIFDGYAACADIPSALFWRQISRHYPEAKVILTIRDVESWLASIATMTDSGGLTHVDSSPLAPLFKRMMPQGGPPGPDQMAQSYRMHNRAIVDGIPRDRLLVYQVRQGWAPLCSFLGVPVPNAPFPHANSKAEHTTIAGPDGHLATSYEAGRQHLREYLERHAVKLEPASG